jgi:hypothetical protein
MRPTLQQFGLLLFGLTVAAHLVVGGLNDLMRSRNRWMKFLKTVLITLVLVLIVVGVASAAGLLGLPFIWRRMVQINYWFTHPSGWRTWSLTALVGLFFVASIRGDFRKQRPRA